MENRLRLEGSVGTGFLGGLGCGAGDFLGGGDAEDFLDGGHSLSDEAPAVFGEGLHTPAVRGVADEVAGGAFEDQFADFVVGIHPLEDAVAAEEAGLAAFAAANGFVDGQGGGEPDLEFESGGGGGGVFEPATIAEETFALAAMLPLARIGIKNLDPCPSLTSRRLWYNAPATVEAFISGRLTAMRRDNSWPAASMNCRVPEKSAHARVPLSQ